MTIFQFTVLFLVFIVLVLIAAHFFHRYERAIFWSVALFLFIGVLVLLGTGVLKIIKDGHANSGALFVAFMCLITAGFCSPRTRRCRLDKKVGHPSCKRGFCEGFKRGIDGS